MQTTTAEATLSRFRQAVYRTLGRRKDTLFELLEAALVSPGPANLVHLSLVPVFRRRWSSASDALAEGQVRPARCRALLHAHLEDPPAPWRPIWAGDGTTWPRPAATTSPERTYGHRSTPGLPQDGVVPAWEYEWLVEVPEPGSGWVRPLDVRRRGPRSGTPTEVAVRELRAALARRPAGAARPVATYDSSYDPVTFARAGLAVDVLVRLRSNRRFFRPPGPYKGRGARPKHGPVLRLPDPATHGAPDRTATLDDPVHGRVEVAVWERLHVQSAADAPLTLVRVHVERLPRHARTPKPLWLAWVGGRCRPTCSTSGAGTTCASRSSTASASSSTTSAGRRSARPTRARPIAGAGCWRWGCGCSGWPAPSRPTGASPGSGRCRPPA